MKAPKFPSYDEAVNRKKKKAQNLLSKEEWQALEEERNQKERDKGKRFAGNRKKDVTIAFRTNRKDRELIFKKIAMSGLSCTCQQKLDTKLKKSGIKNESMYKIHQLF